MSMWRNRVRHRHPVENAISRPIYRGPSRLPYVEAAAGPRAEVRGPPVPLASRPMPLRPRLQPVHINLSSTDTYTALTPRPVPRAGQDGASDRSRTLRLLFILDSHSVFFKFPSCPEPQITYWQIPLKSLHRGSTWEAYRLSGGMVDV